MPDDSDRTHEGSARSLGEESVSSESIELADLSLKERFVYATVQQPAVGLLLLVLLLIAFTFFIAFLMYIAYYVF
ncbi:MAG: hypothetical protein ACQETB_02110 [Halobacteriota archaeon]